MTRLLAMPLLVLALGGACAHPQKGGDAESLRIQVEDFHKRVRWKDYRFVTRYIVPERRKDFERSLEDHHDEQDLDVTRTANALLDIIRDAARVGGFAGSSGVVRPAERSVRVGPDGRAC